METERFVGWYDAMAGGSSTALARDEVTTGG